MLSTTLARGQAAAEALMTDACLIRRVAGEYTDPATGVVTSTYETVYEGKCRVQQSQLGSSARTERAGEAHLLMVSRVLSLPVAASTGVRADDQVLMTASAADLGLVGRRFVIRAEAAKSHATARRLGVEEVTS